MNDKNSFNSRVITTYANTESTYTERSQALLADPAIDGVVVVLPVQVALQASRLGPGIER